ncbi:MAG: hypothetical protein Q8K82_24135, partial [Gemmatimonadaceae bacterium]|nr:hypothetical protein [Gemmatimonadaceae bacterium]
MLTCSIREPVRSPGKTASTWKRVPRGEAMGLAPRALPHARAGGDRPERRGSHQAPNKDLLQLH